MKNEKGSDASVTSLDSSERDRETRWWRVLIEIPVIFWGLLTESIKFAGIVFGGWVLWNAAQETGAELIGVLDQAGKLYMKLLEPGPWNMEQITLAAAVAFGVGLALYKSYIVWVRLRSWAREHFGGTRKARHLTINPS